MVTKIANWVKPPFYLVCKSYQIIHIHRPVERFWTTLTMFLFILFLHSNLSALVQLSPSLLFPMILFVDFSSTFYAVILALWQDSQLSVYDLQVDHRHLVWQEVVREAGETQTPGPSAPVPFKAISFPLYSSPSTCTAAPPVISTSRVKI